MKGRPKQPKEKLAYNDYIKRLAVKIEARLSEIEAAYNFDLGNEYEIAICHLLSDILPKKFGVCRGFLVNRFGKTAGDDIIIYDRLGHPTLRSSIGENFHLKDQIPVEAVYAYIECKHTLSLSTDSLEKGIAQVEAAKKLLLGRSAKSFDGYDKQFLGKKGDWPRALPKLKNQPFGMLVSRMVDESITIGSLNGLNIRGADSKPDLIVAGSDIIMTPTVVLGPDGFKSSLFHIPENSISLNAERIEKLALALGFITLMQVLGWIELEPIDWSYFINETFWESK